MAVILILKKTKGSNNNAHSFGIAANVTVGSILQKQERVIKRNRSMGKKSNWLVFIFIFSLFRKTEISSNPNTRLFIATGSGIEISNKRRNKNAELSLISVFIS